jgi:hypothetical protein
MDLCLRDLDRRHHVDLSTFPDYDLILEEIKSYYAPLYSEEELEAIILQHYPVEYEERLIQTQLFIDHELPEDSAGGAWRAEFGNRKAKEKQKEKKKRQKEKRKGKGMMP